MELKRVYKNNSAGKWHCYFFGLEVRKGYLIALWYGTNSPLIDKFYHKKNNLGINKITVFSWYKVPYSCYNSKKNSFPKYALSELNKKYSVSAIWNCYMRQGVTGDFSFQHLCAIHRQLFQDICAWVGTVRTVDISKGTIFCLVQFIEDRFAYLYRRLKRDNFFMEISDKEKMSVRLAYYLAEINMIHSFREGNGRSLDTKHNKERITNGFFEIREKHL
ncbi:MAG: Fic family protein [Anaerostipes sp.]|nr:Fic family protein [Anaerostipes sp.]